jgi:hypothetical protein
MTVCHPLEPFGLGFSNDGNGAKPEAADLEQSFRSAPKLAIRGSVRDARHASAVSSPSGAAYSRRNSGASGQHVFRAFRYAVVRPYSIIGMHGTPAQSCFCSSVQALSEPTVVIVG